MVVVVVVAAEGAADDDEEVVSGGEGVVVVAAAVDVEAAGAAGVTLVYLSMYWGLWFISTSLFIVFE